MQEWRKHQVKCWDCIQSEKKHVFHLRSVNYNSDFHLSFQLLSWKTWWLRLFLSWKPFIWSRQKDCWLLAMLRLTLLKMFLTNVRHVMSELWSFCFSFTKTRSYVKYVGWKKKETNSHLVLGVLLYYSWWQIVITQYTFLTILTANSLIFSTKKLKEPSRMLCES